MPTHGRHCPLLLDFSKVESGTMKLQVSSSDIVQFLRRVVMSFESWAERKTIRLEFRSEMESAGGFFDNDKLEKIMNNLMSNAMKFTPEEGRVYVTLSRLLLRLKNMSTSRNHRRVSRLVR